MTTMREAVARARSEAFPRPIVTLRMSQEQFDAAYGASNEVEKRELTNGLISGQIVGPTLPSAQEER